MRDGAADSGRYVPLAGAGERSRGMMLSRPVVVVVGPTASGKTDVAQELALRLGGEVVSADSMQIYSGMDIGTGKLPVSERRVPHWGLDIREPGQAYSAAQFQRYARERFADIDARGGRCVLAGGTGFYVRAAIDDYDFASGEQVGNPVREKWNAFLAEHGAPALWNELLARDPDSAALIHPNNAKRVVRALEMLELDGLSYADQHEGLARIAQYVPALFFGLAVDAELLKRRIDARVDAMFASGLVDEVRGLMDRGFGEALTAREAIGYKEVAAALAGRMSMTEASDAIKLATRRYAKRQRSWWRGDPRVAWVDADDGDAARIAGEIEAALGERPQKGE